MPQAKRKRRNYRLKAGDRVVIESGTPVVVSAKTPLIVTATGDCCIKVKFPGEAPVIQRVPLASKRLPKQ